VKLHQIQQSKHCETFKEILIRTRQLWLAAVGWTGGFWWVEENAGAILRTCAFTA